MCYGKKQPVTLVKDSGASGIWGWEKNEHVWCGMVQVERWHKIGKDRELKASYLRDSIWIKVHGKIILI